MNPDAGSKAGERAERNFLWEWLRTLDLSSLEKSRLSGDLIALYNFLRRGSGEGHADLFSLGSTGRMGGNSSKLYLGRLRLGIRKYFFIKRVARCRNRLPRVLVNAPYLEVFKRHLGSALNNMLLWFNSSWQLRVTRLCSSILCGMGRTTGKR